MSAHSPRLLYPSISLVGITYAGAVVLNLHVLLHIAIVCLAAFLAFVSVVSYLRVARMKLLLIALAFALLAVQEFLIMAEVVFIVPADLSFSVEGSQLEISHVLTLLSLSFFSGGLFSRA